MIDVTTETVIGVAEAAKLLGMCEGAIRGYLIRGELEGAKVGGKRGSKWRTSVQAVQRFLKPPPPPYAGPTLSAERQAADAAHEAAMVTLRALGVA